MRLACLLSLLPILASGQQVPPDRRDLLKPPMSKAEEDAKYMRPRRAPMPASARLAAYAQRLRMEAAGPFSQIKWRSAGPEYQGGRVIDFDVPERRADWIYIAYATGGLWRTEDGGITFTPLFDSESAYAIGDIAASRDGRTIWVGTGENNSQRTSYSGTGVFKSADAGRTWRNMGLHATHRIGRVVIDPRSEDTVYVAALGALYSQNPERGVFKTTDGGRTWSHVLKIDDITGAVDLAMDPRDSRVLYATTWERDRRTWNFREGGPGSAIYKTTDGGRSWTKLGGGLPATGNLGRIGVAVAPSNPSIVYAFFDNQSPEEDWIGKDERIPSGTLTPRRFLVLTEEQFLSIDPKALEPFFRAYLPAEVKQDETLARIRDKKMTLRQLADEMVKRNPSVFSLEEAQAQVYRSDDAGRTWRRTHQQPLGFQGGYYGGRIAVSPHDPNDIVTAGVEALRSRDGGRTWTEFASPVHVDFHAFWYDPRNPRRILVGNDGGPYITGDDGASWHHWNTIPVGQFTTIAIDMKTPYNIYGGTQDNGTLRGPSTWTPGRPTRFGAGWETIGGGDGSAVAISPDGNIVYTASQFGAHSARNTSTNERWNARPARTPGLDALRFNWVSPLIISPHHPDIIYVGSQYVHRSFNQARRFEAISPDVTKNLPNGDVPYSTLKDLSESPLKFGLIYAGADDGSVKRTDDGGNTWVDISTPQPSKWVSRVVASKWDKATVYCSQSGYREDEWSPYLWKSTDYGKTWRSIVGNLPAETINVVREDPNKQGWLYVGTDLGVWVSMDDGASWEALNGGIPRAPVHDLVVHPRENELVIATHSRSTWVLPLKSVHEVTPELRKTDLKLWPVADMRRDPNWGYRRFPEWDISDPAPPIVRMQLWSAQAGRGTIRIKTKDGKVVKEKAFEAATGMNFPEVDLQTAPGRPFTTDPSKRQVTKPEDLMRDPREDERPKYLPAGDYVIEVQVGDKIVTQDWKLTA